MQTLIMVVIKDIRENLKHPLQKPHGKAADFPEFLVMNYRLGKGWTLILWYHWSCFRMEVIFSQWDLEIFSCCRSYRAAFNQFLQMSEFRAAKRLEILFCGKLQNVLELGGRKSSFATPYRTLISHRKENIKKIPLTFGLLQNKCRALLCTSADSSGIVDAV